MLSTTFLGIEFKNPLVLASGILGVTGASLAKTVRDGAGGVTMKSASKTPRTGHPGPVMVGRDEYFLNAVGLSNPGVGASLPELETYKQLTHAPLIGSVFAGTPEEFAEVTETLSQAPIDLLELDLSCPNVSREFGDPFAYSKNAIETIIKQVKAKTTKKISVKLSPNAWNIAELGKAAEAAGADAITAVNTVSGLSIDIRSRRPVLYNKHGGISGPALFPIALKCVYDLYEAIKIPIIGTGGITTGEDAIAMTMAGATLIGVGSAVYYRGTDVFQKITEEMEEFMRAENIKTLDEIRGAAH